MNLGLILSLIKVGLEVFQNERKDILTRKYLKIQSEYQDELNKGLDDRSDLKLDRLRFDAEQLAHLLISEHSKK
jgi:hypothetical protein